MEFKDIKNFEKIIDKKKKKSGKVYEDDANFCKERFEDAKLSCDIVFDYSYDKEPYDGIIMFLPMEKNVKLNNFKKYVEEIGAKTNVLKAAEWEKVSTPEMY